MQTSQQEGIVIRDISNSSYHIYIMRSRLHNSFMTRGDNDQLSTYIGGQTVRRIKNDKQKWKTNKVVNEVH